MSSRTARELLVDETLSGIYTIANEVANLRRQIEELPPKLEASVGTAAARTDRAAQAIQQATQQLIDAGQHHQDALREYIDRALVPRINQAAVEATHAMSSNVKGGHQVAGRPSLWRLVWALGLFSAGLAIGYLIRGL